MATERETIKFFPSTIVIGLSGLPCVKRGFSEIGRMRFYEDQVVIGKNGEHMISRGWMEGIPND